MEDKRKIRFLHLLDGSMLISEDWKIVPYHENGEMSAVIWFAHININGEIMKRIHRNAVKEIEY